MEQISTPFRPCLLSCDKGFTILELLVASFVGLIMSMLTLSITLSNRGLFQYDIARTRLNQNLRSSLDIVGINIREAGENLPITFPAVEIINGAGTDPDELILRRNLLDEVLKVCQAITAGTTDDVYFGNSSTVPGCAYADQEQNFNAWQEYRTDNGGTVKAYIYDPVADVGEFFDYYNETDTGTARLIQRSGGWENDYPVGNSAVYLLEEWHFKLDTSMFDSNMLQVIEDGDDSNPLNITFDIEDFQVTAILSDGTTLNDFPGASNWTELRALEVEISGNDTSKGRLIEKTVSGQYFPRNILSN